MDFKEGLKAGLVITLVIAILSPLVRYIAFTYVSPMYLTNMVSYFVEKKIMTQEQALFQFSLNNTIKEAAYNSLVMGVIAAAIVVAFIRSKNKNITNEK